MGGVELKRKYAGNMQNTEVMCAVPGLKDRSSDISAKLREIGNLVAEGHLITAAIRKTGIAESTYYRWRAELSRDSAWQDSKAVFGEEAKLRILESENGRLRAALADLILERQILKEAFSRKL